MERSELEAYLAELLEVSRFKDYCPNGLQVEGRAEIRRIVCGVTASQALLDIAVEREADAVMVHHGYFWKGEDGRVTGFRKRRLSTLLKHDINLFAYHLPLDGHEELGNNARLGMLMGWQPEGRFGEQALGWMGTTGHAETADMLCRSLTARLGREVMLVGDDKHPVRRVAWCTGAAQGFFEDAILAGADAFVSGEISEQTVHLARETGIPYLAAGHHATERYGIKALGRYLEAHLGLECLFVDVPNPV